MDNQEEDDFDRKINRTKKIIILVVIPVLFGVALFLYFSDTFEDKQTYLEIISEVDAVHCYNISWFGTFGFQIIYMETSMEVADILDGYNMDFSQDEFFKDQEVVDYLVINCPHLNNKLNLPDKFDPEHGMPAVDQCLKVKEGLFGSEDYCMQFKQ